MVRVSSPPYITYVIDMYNKYNSEFYYWIIVNVVW